jgi:hypothetical protein
VYLLILQTISFTFCLPYVVTPFVTAISQRIYYLARLEQAIQFLKDHCSNHMSTKQEQELLAEWERFHTFKQVQDQDYEKAFVKKLFRILYESTIPAKVCNNTDVQLQQQITTDDIAFRYFLVQRLENIFALLTRVQTNRFNESVGTMSERAQIITHPDIQSLLLEILQEQNIIPLLNEWEHILHYKNLSDTDYMKEFLVLTYLCIQHLIQKEDSCVAPQKNIVQLIAMIDDAFPSLYTKITPHYFSTTSLFQKVFNMGIPLTIISLLVLGQI